MLPYMDDRHYIYLKENGVKTYLFQAELEQDEDGRWSAWIDALPGCAVWGHSQHEALEALHDAATAYIEVLKEKGQHLPLDKAIETAKTPVVAVTI